MNIDIFPKKDLLDKWSEDKKWYETTVGEPPKCLRCGRAMPSKISHCALSRYIDVQICPECGTEEAMLDWDGKALPLRNWHAAQNAEASVAPVEGEVTVGTTATKATAEFGPAPVLKGNSFTLKLAGFEPAFIKLEH